jgi:hypothetical protein
MGGLLLFYPKYWLVKKCKKYRELTSYNHQPIIGNLNTVKIIHPLAVQDGGWKSTIYSFMNCASANYSNFPCHVSLATRLPAGYFTWKIHTFNGHIWDHHFTLLG